MKANLVLSSELDVFKNKIEELLDTNIFSKYKKFIIYYLVKTNDIDLYNIVIDISGQLQGLEEEIISNISLKISKCIYMFNNKKDIVLNSLLEIYNEILQCKNNKIKTHI